MKKAKKRRSQSRIAMISITFVVGLLFVGMMGKSVALESQLSSYNSQIDDLKEYMKTDEYVEETAREKLGLVKENEIVFKEGEDSQQEDSTSQTEDSQKDQSTQEEQKAQTESSDQEEAEG